MKFSEAIKILDERNRKGRIPNRRTGKYGSISREACAGLVSSTRVALRAATGKSAVEKVDILPLAEALPDHALADAEDAGHVNPANAVDRVRRFLAIVEGKEYEKARGGENFLRKEWKSLYHAALELGNNYAPRIASLYRVAVAPKPDGSSPILDPADLPSQETVRQWLKGAGYKRRRPGRIIRAYQLARASLPEEQQRALPPLDEYQPEENGLRGLPNLTELLTGRGISIAEFLSLQAIDRIGTLHPNVRFGLELYLEENADLSKGWRKSAIGGVERVLAAMERCGMSAADLDLLDLYIETVELAGKGGIETVNPLLEARYGSDKAFSSAESRYLIQSVADEVARASFENSPLELVDPALDSDVPYYTATARRDLQHFYQMCRVAYEGAKRIRASDWTTMEVVHDQLKDHFKKHNKKHKVYGQKKKEAILEIITLPQIICMGLPAMRREVLEQRELYHRRLVDENAESSVQTARNAYGAILRDYLITAVMIADGLRVANYTGARLGRHFLPEPRRDGDGKWTGLEAMDTYWRGYDDPSVKLKIAEDELKAERSRRWGVRPGIVDLHLFYEYLIDLRVDDLIAAGLVDSAEMYDPDLDMTEWHFAVFPSGHPASVTRAGCYSSTQSISEAFGRSLHWMATEVLGRDLPEWSAAELKEQYRALFSGHITRLHIGTYWGGVRGNWLRACLLTDDTEGTLRTSYSVVGAKLVERMTKDDWTNPHHFDGEMDAIFRGEIIHWD